MREIFKFNLKELKKLDESPLLAIHFNLTKSSEDLIMLDELIEKEGDEKLVYFKEAMARALFYRTQGKWELVISALEYINKNIEIDLINPNESDIIHSALISLLLAEGYFYATDRNNSLFRASLHCSTAISMFEELDNIDSMRENLIYSMALNEKIKHKMNDSSSVIKPSEELEWLIFGSSPSIYTITFLKEQYEEDYLDHMFFRLKDNVDDDPFEILKALEYSDSPDYEKFIKAIALTKSNGSLPAFLLEASKVKKLMKDDGFLSLLDDEIDHMHKAFPLLALRIAENLHKNGEQEFSLSYIFDIEMEDKEDEKERQLLLGDIRYQMYRNECGPFDFVDLPEIDINDDKSINTETIYFLKLLSAILIIKNLYVYNAAFTLVLDLIVLYLFLGEQHVLR